MDAVERVIAIEEIRQLKARYFRCVDTKDWEGLNEVFAPDIVFDRTYGKSVQDPWTRKWTPPLPVIPLLVRGREQVIAMIKDAVRDLITVHHGHMLEISFTDSDFAMATWSMSDELRDRDGRIVLVGRGHYHDTCRRSEGVWRIESSQLTRLSLAGPSTIDA